MHCPKYSLLDPLCSRPLACSQDLEQPLLAKQLVLGIPRLRYSIRVQHQGAPFVEPDGAWLPDLVLQDPQRQPRTGQSLGPVASLILQEEGWIVACIAVGQRA